MIGTARMAVAVLAASAVAPATVHAQAGCGGLLQPACPPPTPTAPATPSAEHATVSLTPASVRRTHVHNGVSVVFSGRVEGVPRPEELSVTLAVEYPSYGPRTLPTGPRTTIAADGTFSARIRTDVTATVQAIVDGLSAPVHSRVIDGTSPVRTLHVRAATTQLRVLVGGRDVELVARYPGPGALVEGPREPLRLGPGRRAYFYIGTRGRRFATRVGSALLQPKPCDRVCVRSAATTISDRRAARGDTAYVCVRGPVYAGIEQKTSRGCGARRIRLR